MKKFTKRLELNKETLRILDASEVQQAPGGGSVSLCFTDCPTDATCRLGVCSGRLVCTN
jgi:hypothetical protein